MAEFDLSLLESFIVLAEELHFGRAAERLLVAQPALSRRIARLESQLGLQLAERDSRGVRLTPAGHVFAERGRAALDLIEHGATAARTLLAVHALSLAWNADAELVLSPIVTRARAQVPEFRFDYRGLVDSVGLAGVQLRDIDIAILSAPAGEPMPELAQYPVLAVENGVVLPDGHPLLRQLTLTAEDLDDQDLILLPRQLSPPFHDFLRSRLRTSRSGNRTVEVVIESHGLHATMMREVAAGRGFAPVCRPMFDVLAPLGVTYRPIDPPMISVMYAVHRRDAREDVRAFTALLRNTADRHPEMLAAGCFPCGPYVHAVADVASAGR